MNIEVLKESAIKLEHMLNKYELLYPSVASLSERLLPLTAKAKAGKITTPLEEEFSHYMFIDGPLNSATELESAYSDFTLLVTMEYTEYTAMQKKINELISSPRRKS